MFSGIIEAMGTVEELRSEPPGCRLIIRQTKLAAETAVADSISINGCCLTVVAVDEGTIGFQAGPETLARTNLGELRSGSQVNLERALRVGDRLGGHFVSGHIDGTRSSSARGFRRVVQLPLRHFRGNSPGRWPPRARSPWTA